MAAKLESPVVKPLPDAMHYLFNAANEKDPKKTRYLFITWKKSVDQYDAVRYGRKLSHYKIRIHSVSKYDNDSNRMWSGIQYQIMQVHKEDYNCFDKYPIQSIVELVKERMRKWHQSLVKSPYPGNTVQTVAIITTEEVISTLFKESVPNAKVEKVEGLATLVFEATNATIELVAHSGIS